MSEENKSEEKKEEAKSEPKYYRGPGGSALGDLIRARAALDIKDPKELAAVWKMLNGG